MSGQRSARQHAIRWARGIVRTAVTVLIVLCFVALAVRVGVPESSASTARSSVSGRPSALDTLETARHLERLEAAIEVFRLKSGRLPESLDEVVGAGLIGERALTYPAYETTYFYERSAQGYQLYPPRR